MTLSKDESEILLITEEHVLCRVVSVASKVRPIIAVYSRFHDICIYGMWQYNVIIPFLQNEMKTERPFPLYETPHPFRQNGQTVLKQFIAEKRLQNNALLNNTMKNDLRPFAAPLSPLAAAPSRFCCYSFAPCCCYSFAPCCCYSFAPSRCCSFMPLLPHLCALLLLLLRALLLLHLCALLLLLLHALLLLLLHALLPLLLRALLLLLLHGSSAATYLRNSTLDKYDAENNSWYTKRKLVSASTLNHCNLMDTFSMFAHQYNLPTQAHATHACTTCYTQACTTCYTQACTHTIYVHTQAHTRTHTHFTMRCYLLCNVPLSGSLVRRRLCNGSR